MAIQTVFFDLGDTLVKQANTKMWLPGAQSLLGALRAKAFRLGIISGTGDLTPRQAILNILPTDFDITLFESALVLFTSEIGIAKPKKELFEKAVAAAGTQASECLYCSESIIETLVAQHVGMRTIRVQTSPNNDLASVESEIAKYHTFI